MRTLNTGGYYIAVSAARNASTLVVVVQISIREERSSVQKNWEIKVGDWMAIDRAFYDVLKLKLHDIGFGRQHET